MSALRLLIPLLLIILAGFVSGKARLFDDVGRKALAKFVFYIATSALIISAITSIQLSYLHKFPRFVFANTFIVILTFIATYIVLRMMKVSYKTGASVLYAGNVANNIYLGLPLIRALYGSQGLIYAIAFLAIPMTITDIVDFYILSRWRKGKVSLKLILNDFIKNPVVASTLIGIVLLLLRVNLPAEIKDSLNYLGVSATGLALFAMGVFLSLSSWKHFNHRVSLATTVVKLAAAPALAYFLARYLFSLQGIPLFVSVMMAALPSAIFCMIVASEYDFDERNTADAIMLSTVLFLITSIFWAGILR